RVLGLSRLAPLGGLPQPPPAPPPRGGPRQGAEPPGPGRTVAPLRHQGAAGLLAAPPRRGQGDSLLRAHQPGGGLGCRLHDRFRRRLPRHLAGPRGARHPPQLAQAPHHALPDRHRPRARVHVVGERNEIGITLALVPTSLPGVDVGRRHLPALMVFQNGPTTGRDVFIPIDNVIGGVAQAGKGWKMLTSALAAGRGISLPSLSAAGTAFAAHTTGAYAPIRE